MPRQGKSRLPARSAASPSEQHPKFKRTGEQALSSQADALREADAVFRKWLGPEYDLDMFHAVAAAIAVERLDGDPCWLLIMSGSGNAKTETVCAAEGAGAFVHSTITSEGALLSGTSRKESTSEATGGLLRSLGSRGVVVVKDMTSILSMSRDSRTSVMAALREICDGRWVRNVGTDGGRTLTWEGRIVVIGAVTSSWDSHHQVISAMGDRFLILRVDSSNPTGRRAAGLQAIANTGQEGEMRRALPLAFGAVFADFSTAQVNPTNRELVLLLGLADIVTRARTVVEREPNGAPLYAHAHESPTRLSKGLVQMMRGGVAVGLGRRQGLRLAIRIAGDCLPPPRRAVLEAVFDLGTCSVPDLRRATRMPETSAKRVADELVMLGLLDPPSGTPQSNLVYQIAPDTNLDDLRILLSGVVPSTRNGSEPARRIRRSGGAAP